MKYLIPSVDKIGTVFDAEYYAETYPDLQAVFGNDAEALYNHYVMFGRAEGRQPAAENAVIEELWEPYPLTLLGQMAHAGGHAFEHKAARYCRY